MILLDTRRQIQGGLLQSYWHECVLIIECPVGLDEKRDWNSNNCEAVVPTRERAIIFVLKIDRVSNRID